MYSTCRFVLITRLCSDGSELVLFLLSAHGREDVDIARMLVGHLSDTCWVFKTHLRSEWLRMFLSRGGAVDILLELMQKYLNSTPFQVYFLAVRFMTYVVLQVGAHPLFPIAVRRLPDSVWYTWLPL